MSRRASVVLAHGLAEVGRERTETDSLCGDIKIVLYETLMVVEYFDHGVPLSACILCLDLIMLDEALGEAEGGVIMACRHKEDHRGVQTVGVAVGILAVKVAVEYEAHARDVCGLVEGVCDRLVGLAVVAVVIAPDSAVDAVQERGAIAVVCGEGRLLCKLGGLSAEAGKEAAPRTPWS